MDDTANSQAKATVESIYREESTRVLATLIRYLGDFDRAEDAAQDAFHAALQQWPKEGIPSNPRAWLISVGRFKAIDAIRRNERQNTPLNEIEDQLPAAFTPDFEDRLIEDDRLRLVFICCHPDIPQEAQVALTLREVCGLTTEEIARAFLIPSTTLAQRIVRAKARIREQKLSYEIPNREDLPMRLAGVLRVIYLVFNEGYYASSGYSLTRVQLSQEAIRIGRIVADLLPDPDVWGLLSLMLLQESRRAARSNAKGDLILLGDQDRSLWDQNLINEGVKLSQLALECPEPGAYAYQSAIAATHAQSPASEKTDWGQVILLYDRLLRINPSPIIELNRAVAVSMNGGIEAGLKIVDGLLGDGPLEDYGLAHSARADFCRRLGRKEEAKASYYRALQLASQEPERQFLSRRIQEVSE